MSNTEMILLKIGNEADRVTVASILYKNGYEVKPVRRKKNGKSYEYFVGCRPVDDENKGGTPDEG